MMRNEYDHKFVIEGLKPDQIPVDRLRQYSAQIAKMLGIRKKMHLADTEIGSVVLAFSIDESSLPVAKDMEAQLRKGTAPIHAKAAHDKISRMLQEDKTPASLRDQGGAEIIKFPVREKEIVPDRIIHDKDTFKGRLHQISYAGEGKADDDAPAIVTIKTHRKEGMVTCHTNVAMAKEMSAYLSRYVSVSGEGTWLFDKENKEFKLLKFVATEFMPLRDDESITEFIDRIRGMTTDWPADLMDRINRFEERNQD